jgi:hypothetical protein
VAICHLVLNISWRNSSNSSRAQQPLFLSEESQVEVWATHRVYELPSSSSEKLIQEE